MGIYKQRGCRVAGARRGSLGRWEEDEDAALHVLFAQSARYKDYTPFSPGLIIITITVIHFVDSF